MYDLLEHRHRFSVWAAARASQRGCKDASIETLRDAVEHCGVQQFAIVDGPAGITVEVFQQLHRGWCRSIVAFLTDRGVASFSFGRAAKLIAVYLKSMVILGPNHNANLAHIIHPPIDAILLRNLSRSTELDSVKKAGWARIRWTQLDEHRYFALVSELRESLPAGEPFWMIERFWTVTDE